MRQPGTGNVEGPRDDRAASASPAHAGCGYGSLGRFDVGRLATRPDQGGRTMIKRFQRSSGGRQLRKLYMKQRGRIHYLLVKTVLRRRMLVRKQHFAENLVLLHDVLEGSELSRRYWI